MTFKERLESLKAKFQAKITPESSADEINAVNEDIAELDALNADYDGVVTEQGKLKNTIVRMALTQGNDKAPKDGADGSKPMTIQEAFDEVASKQGGK